MVIRDGDRGEVDFVELDAAYFFDGCSVGSWMFVHWFDRALTPLIIVSGVFTLFCFALMPLLKGIRKQKEDDQK